MVYFEQEKRFAYNVLVLKSSLRRDLHTIDR